MPREPLVVEPEDHKGDCYSIFAVSGGAMGAIFSGCGCASMIEDGRNGVLVIRGGAMLVNPELI